LVAKEEFALDQLVASELEQEIDVAINSLPHQCREVFYNSRFENLSIREVADKLHLSESTVKTQLWRAIEKLREMLKHHL
jgi:RNA polymerase sigma-70 factor (ECF subfamily)